MQPQPQPFTLPTMLKVAHNAEKATTVAEAVAGHPAVLQPKLDGWRSLWVIEHDGRCRFYARSGKEQTGKMPAVEAALSTLLPPGTVLDGEVVAYTEEDGHVAHNWGMVQSVLGSSVPRAALMSARLTLVVFDLIALDNKDARSLPYAARRGLLEGLFDGIDFPASVRLIEQLPPTDESHERLLMEGYEGSIVRWLDARYASGKRGHGVFKIKGEDEVDVIVVGFTPGNAGWEGMVGAIDFGQVDPGSGRVVQRGSCSGFDMRLRKALTAAPDSHVGRVFTIRHNGVFPPGPNSPHGAFRHPQFRRWRDDRTAEDVLVHDA